MVTVEQAEKLTLAEAKDFGTEIVAFEDALGRTLAEDIEADRDLPPFNQVTMDGIALSYATIEKGIQSFKIKATQAAGDNPIDIGQSDECIEIMTGASLPSSMDTIIPYEHINIEDSVATIITSGAHKGQNVHLKGADKKQGDIVAAKQQLITPALISVAASVGKTVLLVKKNATCGCYFIRR